MAISDPDVFQVKGGPIDTTGVRSILLIQLGDIGDVVVTFPCVRALKENFPAAAVHVAVHEKAAGLIAGCRWADGVIVARQTRGLAGTIRHGFDLFSRLKHLRFDLVFDLRTGDRGAIMTLLTGARQRVSFWGRHNTWWRNRIFTHLVQARRHNSPFIVDYYLGLPGVFGIRPQSSVPVFDVSAEHENAARDVLAVHGIADGDAVVAVQPFSLWAYKEWPADRMGAFMDWLRQRYLVRVIVTGAPDQKARADGMVAGREPSVVNLAGRTSLPLLAALLKRCSMAIGVDSAGCHLAAAVGTPTATIFGPGNFTEWAPRGAHHRVVHHDMPCIPCRDKGCNGSERSRCLETLEVDRVIDHVRPQLDDLLEVKWPSNE